MAGLGRGTSSVRMWCYMLLISLVSSTAASSELSPDFYDSSCRDVQSVVRAAIRNASDSDPRIVASLLRLHFHDCFVNGCDGSVLLVDTSTFLGEQTSPHDVDSLRGFEVVDNVKASVEAYCPNTVSCADILAIAARDSVFLAGGPSWTVELGRRDSTNASWTDAANDLPGFDFDTSSLKSSFAAVGLDAIDLVALSGAHTYGKAQCISFQSRLYNFNGTGSPDPSMDPDLVASLQRLCPEGQFNLGILTKLDQITTGYFDNAYFVDLITNSGLLFSDQTLYTTPGITRDTVIAFANDQSLFFDNFATSMIKMGRIRPLTGSEGQIRTDCKFPNDVSGLSST